MPMFVPRRRSQQGVRDSRAVTTLSLLDNCISRDQYFRCGISLPVVHTFSTLAILHIFHTYNRVSRPVVLCPVVPLYKYHIKHITHSSSRCPSSLVPSSRHPVIPSFHAIINNSDLSHNHASLTMFNNSHTFR